MRAETALQSTVMQMLRVVHPELVACAIPNGSWFGAADPKRVAMIVHKMKLSGLITPGASDIVVAGHGKVAFLELKTPAGRDLLGKRIKGGVMSEDQKLFQSRCVECGVSYFVVHDWDEVEDAVKEVWG
jgi:hypothetical protein